MPIDPSIYNALNAPRKSAVDYANEYAQADLDREAGRQKNEMNALALSGARAKFADESRVRDEQTGIRNALSAMPAGATADQRISTLRGLGTQTALSAADAMEKGYIDRMKAQSEIGARDASTATSQYDLARKRFEHGITSLTGASSPDAARQSIAAGVQQGLLDPEAAHLTLAEIPDDPRQYMRWRMEKLQGLLSAKDQLDQQRQAADFGLKQAEFQRKGAQFERTAAQKDRELGIQETKVAQDGVKPLTEGQSKGLLFGSRARDAAAIVDQLEASGVTGVSALARYAGDGKLGDLANAQQSPDQQRYGQAQRDFITAVLRKESGAVIGAGEFQSAVRQYFPSPGDSPEVLAQKAGNRRMAVQGLLAEVPEAQRGALPSQQRAPQAQQQKPAQAGGPVRIAGDADYARLPSGTVFIGPDGKRRTKP